MSTKEAESSIEKVQKYIDLDIIDTINRISKNDYDGISLADNCNIDTYDQNTGRYYDLDSDLYKVACELDHDVLVIDSNRSSYISVNRAEADIHAKMPVLQQIHEAYEDNPHAVTLIKA